MSYDMSIGKSELNYTYNVAPMWYSILPEKGIRTFYGMTGKESLQVLTYLYFQMIGNADNLKKMNPENGWGSFDGALTFVNDLILAAIENPDEVWEGD